MIAQGFFLAGLVAAAVAGHATFYNAGGLGHGHGYGLEHGLGGGHGGGHGGSYSFAQSGSYAGNHGGSYGGSYGGDHGGSYGGHGHHVVDYHTPAHYDFHYGVEDHHTGDSKQQTESRSGDVVHGQYSLAEADGTTRIVKYTADDHNGFNAVVKRIGHAAHPQVVSAHGHHGDYGYGGHGHGY